MVRSWPELKPTKCPNTQFFKDGIFKTCSSLFSSPPSTFFLPDSSIKIIEKISYPVAQKCTSAAKQQQQNDTSFRKEAALGAGISLGSLVYSTEISRHLHYGFSLLESESVSPCVGHSAKLHFLLQAFSAYYYVMEFLNFTSEETPTQEKVIDSMGKFCSQPWNEVSD